MTALPVTIEDFGAVPDWNGTTGTDNAAAIQRAIDSEAHTIFVPAKPFRIGSGLLLGNGQQLAGERAALYTPSRALPQSLLSLAGAAPRIAAIRNKSKTSGQTVSGISLQLNDTTHLGVQFSGSYGNVVDGLTFYGRFDVGVALDDTYVCRVRDVVVCGCHVRRAIVYVGKANAITIERLHSSSFPVDPGICMRGIALYGGGRNFAVQSPVLQGPTIGLHVGKGILGVVASDIYTENTVRLGEGAEGPHAVTLQGLFSPAYDTNPQSRARGPLIWYEAGHAVRIDPSRFDAPPAPLSASGPWPILCGSGAGSLSVEVQSAFNSAGELELIFRQSERATPTVAMCAVAGDRPGDALLAPALIRGAVSALIAARMPRPAEILV